MKDLPRAENIQMGAYSSEVRPSVVEAPAQEMKSGLLSGLKERFSSFFSRNSAKSEPASPRIAAQADSLLQPEESHNVITTYAEAINILRRKQDDLGSQTVSKLEVVTQGLDPLQEGVGVVEHESMLETAERKSQVEDPLTPEFYDTLKGLQKRGLFDVFRSEDQMVKMLAVYTSQLESAQASLRFVLDSGEVSVDKMADYFETVNRLLAQITQAEENLAYYMEIINKQSGRSEKNPVFAPDRIEQLRKGAAESSYTMKDTPLLPRSLNPSRNVHRAMGTRRGGWESWRAESPLSV